MISRPVARQTSAFYYENTRKCSIYTDCPISRPCATLKVR